MVCLMAAKGLTRRITRKQARSYELTSPNPGSGVTAIAAVMNRRRKKAKKPSASYARRYAQTHAILSGKGKKMRTTKRRARKNYEGWAPWHEEQKATVKRVVKKATKASKARRAKLAAARRAAEKKRMGKRYGPYKSVTARVGKRTVPTFAYQGKKGKAKKIPLWAIAGAKSQKDFERRAADEPRMARRVVAAKKRREKRAEKLLAHGDFFTPNRRRRTSRARAIPYETWSKNMNVAKKNKRRGKKGHKRGAAFKRTAQYKKMMAGLRKYRRSHGKTAAPKRRKTSGRRKTRTQAQRRATARMLSARWGKRVKRRKAWKNADAATPNPRRRRRRARANAGHAAVPNRRRRRTHRNAAAAPNRRRRRARSNQMYSANRRLTKTQRRAAAKKGWAKRRRAHHNKAAAPNRRRRRARTNQMYANRRHAAPNRRRRHAKRNQMYSANRRRRHYRRNPDVMAQLKSAFKAGAVISLGFLAHRALSYVVSEKLLSGVTAVPADWRGVVGGALMAVAGIPLAAMAAPKQASQIGTGIAVSFLHQLLVAVLKKAGQPDMAGYLAGYPDEEGKAYRSLAGYGAYELMPQSGYGAYELMPQSGYGAYDYYNQYSGFGEPITQAAAGYGAAPMITQAAAGYGAAPYLTQAAAGYGYGAGPTTELLTQAAAGMGEYVATGVQGIGEYEAVQGYGGLGATPYIDEGIHPDTHSAERALTVAEAAAGIGDLPLESTLTPEMIAAPISDAPTGSRAGILEGGDGIFGGPG